MRKILLMLFIGMASVQSYAQNHTSPTDPQAFTIVDNKLYLNYNLKVKELWSKDREERIVKANENWKTLNKK